MKVLLSSTGSDISSGAARCLVELAVQLKIKGIEVLVTIPKRGNIEKYLKENEIQYLYVHEYHSWYTSEKHKKNHFLLKRFMNYRAFFKIRRIIKNEKIDIVHENALTAYVAAWAGESLNIPVVWHMREFMEEDLKITFYNRKYSIRKLNKSSQLIAISEAVANKWKNVFSAPIKVVYDGIPNTYFVKRENKERKTINLIIFGRIVETKGQFFFFQGMKKVINRVNKPIKCYWAGSIEDEEYYKSITDFIKENGMTNYVEYLGEVSNIENVLKDMDIVAVCSRQEGFGRVTVESMFAGCIVVGADTGATREIIRDQVNGFLYKQGNINDFVSKMESVIEHIEENRVLADKARRDAVNKYSIENNVNRIIEIYKSLM